MLALNCGPAFETRALTPLNTRGRRERTARRRGHGRDAGSYSVDSRTVAQADWMCGVSFVQLQGYLLEKRRNTWGASKHVKWHPYKRLWGVFWGLNRSFRPELVSTSVIKAGLKHKKKGLIR